MSSDQCPGPASSITCSSGPTLCEGSDIRNVICSRASSGRCSSSSTYTWISLSPTLAGSTTRLSVPPRNATVDENTPPVDAASRAGVIATNADVIASTTTRPTISLRTVVSRRRHASAERVVFAAPGPPTLASVAVAASRRAHDSLAGAANVGDEPPVVVRRERRRRTRRRTASRPRSIRSASRSAPTASRLPSSRGSRRSPRRRRS